jgi:hypothetical protein
MSDDKAGGGGKPEDPPGHIHIYFDTGEGEPQSKTVHPGQWQVRALKDLFGVDAAKVLAEITASGVNDLNDDDHIAVHEGQKFMAHVRGGGAS